MRIAIVDDDKVWRERTAARIRNFYSHPVEIDAFVSGETFLEYDLGCEMRGEKSFDIVFLDVEMEGGLDGFETTIQFKNRHPDVPVILLTVHGEFSRRGYRVKAFRYLEKQYLEELDEALESIGLLYPKEYWMELPLPDGSSRPLRTADICYVEAISHGTCVHLEKECLRTELSLQKVEKLLQEQDAENFYRCHQAYIVHWKFMREIEESDLIAFDGARIPISRRRLRETHSRLTRYHFQRASR